MREEVRSNKRVRKDEYDVTSRVGDVLTHHRHGVQHRDSVVQTAVGILMVKVPTSDLPVCDSVVEVPRDVHLLINLAATHSKPNFLAFSTEERPLGNKSFAELLEKTPVIL
jgi:hypothetical protein